MTGADLELLTAVAARCIPAGGFMPAADARTSAAVAQWFETLPSVALQGYRALLHAIDAHARLRYRRRFAALSEAQANALLENWQHGNLVRRLALRGIVSPLKLAHFDNPALYQQLGCVYQLPSVGVEATPSYMRDRCHDANELDDTSDVTCDVVVIGTGAGGAVVAKELAEAGVAVVMVEDGGYFTRGDFTGRPFAMQQKLYRDGGATFSVGNVGIAIPIGRTVGGTTTVNSGTCYRAPNSVLQRWQQELGLVELGPDQLAPHFARVESILGVEAVAAPLLGGCARVIARGANAMGLSKHHALARNAPACDGQGVCCFGCPTDAKRSTNVSYVPLALRAGAELFYHCKAQRILHDERGAAGIIATNRQGVALRINARAVVVANGALLTPTFLARQGIGLGSGELGKNLSIHPAAGCLAEFAEPITSWRGIPQSYTVEDFASEGILFEGAATPLEFTMTMTDMVGPALTALAENFERVASFGFMISDQSRGRVRDIGGRTVVQYNLNDIDTRKIQRGVDLLAQMFFAAGASVVHAPIAGHTRIRNLDELARMRNSRVRASQLDLSAYHPLGTARLGASAQTAVLAPNHEVYGTRGVYVVDGSAVPTSLGVNPQVTIMALATRAAQKIADALA